MNRLLLLVAAALVGAATCGASVLYAVQVANRTYESRVAIPDPALADPPVKISYDAGKLDPTLFEPAIEGRFATGDGSLTVSIQINCLTQEEIGDGRSASDPVALLRTYERKTQPVLAAIERLGRRARWLETNPSLGLIRIACGRAELLELQPVLKTYENVHVFTEGIGSERQKQPWVHSTPRPQPVLPGTPSRKPLPKKTP